MASPNAPAGPLLLGYIISLALHGVLTVQLYLYYAAFPRDSMVIKLLVYAVYLGETARSIVMAYDAYDIFAVGFTNRESLYAVHHIWFTCCVSNAILAFVVQILYAYRIKILSTSYTCGISIAFLSFVQLVGGVTAGVGAKLVGNFEAHTTYEFVGYVVNKAGAALCDILIAILMTYYLLRMRKNSRMAEDIITRIIRLVVEAGTMTSLFAVVDLVLYFTDAENGSSWALRLIVGKLYTNSMMVIFNNRFSIRTNRYDNSEATWKSSFLLSGDEAVVQQLDTRISFSHVYESSVRPRGPVDALDGQAIAHGLSRMSSLSTDEVVLKSRI
ncbi:hypothetical protein P691DRAFT_757589 [Macrolepiota fuliginosa MF-IS2]|uniref:DUF6534 domain-containing protein n=1 Tax=Macrolepiota fuliginosa MF-IS2 TaxID=1400762 RepID=A0A9P5XI19_9AGAR|nr:hypothetical protein P691DRAFT_757589 [Macrolepiota fuliginosa MF-IS2]